MLNQLVYNVLMYLLHNGLASLNILQVIKKYYALIKFVVIYLKPEAKWSINK